MPPRSHRPPRGLLRVARTVTRDEAATWAQGSAEALPVADACATHVWALATVHHWRDVPTALTEIRRVLAPGGRLLANVGSVENLASIRELLHRQAGDANTWMINVSRGVYQLERVRFESLNPTFLIGAVKPEEAARD